MLIHFPGACNWVGVPSGWVPVWSPLVGVVFSRLSRVDGHTAGKSRLPDPAPSICLELVALVLDPTAVADVCVMNHRSSKKSLAGQAVRVLFLLGLPSAPVFAAVRVEVPIHSNLVWRYI